MKKIGKKIINVIKNLKWQNFIMLTLAGIINAVGVTLLLNPAGLLDGGLSGTSLFLERITPAYLTLSMFVIVLNVPFYILANKKIGINFVIYSLYAIGIYSLFAFVFKDVCKFDFINNGSPISGKDYFLCSIFGGLLSGIGSGLTIRFGGALDGVEVMAVLFAKKLGLTVGVFVMLYNIILFLILAAYTKSFVAPLYSTIAYFIGIKTVDFLVDGLDKAKSVMIISEQSKLICQALSEDFGRGLTIIEAKGYYSNKERQMIYCVVNRFEITKLKKIIKEIDESAFVAINDTSDTLGRLKFMIGKPNNN